MTPHPRTDAQDVRRRAPPDGHDRIALRACGADRGGVFRTGGGRFLSVAPGTASDVAVAGPFGAISSRALPCMEPPSGDIQNPGQQANGMIVGTGGDERKLGVHVFATHRV